MKFIKCPNCGVQTEVKLNNKGKYKGTCVACESELTV